MGNNRTRTRGEIQQSLASEHRYHSQVLASIRGDKLLSKLGQQQQLQQEQNRHSAAITSLRAEAQAADAAAESVALKALFAHVHRYGMSDQERYASQASYRDAVLKAAVLADERQAQKVYELACITGDELLQRAVALASYQAGWLDVTEKYAASDPDRQAAYNELRELRAPKSAADKFADRMAFSSAPPADLQQSAGASVGAGDGAQSGTGNAGQ